MVAFLSSVMTYTTSLPQASGSWSLQINQHWREFSKYWLAEILLLSVSQIITFLPVNKSILATVVRERACTNWLGTCMCNLKNGFVHHRGTEQKLPFDLCWATGFCQLCASITTGAFLPSHHFHIFCFVIDLHNITCSFFAWFYIHKRQPQLHLVISH